MQRVYPTVALVFPPIHSASCPVPLAASYVGGAAVCPPAPPSPLPAAPLAPGDAEAGTTAGAAAAPPAASTAGTVGAACMGPRGDCGCQKIRQELPMRRPTVSSLMACHTARMPRPMDCRWWWGEMVSCGEGQRSRRQQDSPHTWAPKSGMRFMGLQARFAMHAQAVISPPHPRANPPHLRHGEPQRTARRGADHGAGHPAGLLGTQKHPIHHAGRGIKRHEDS